jgi:hypothetical protein
MTPGAVIAGLAYVLMLGFCGYQLARGTLEEIQALKIANPWDLQAP